MATSITFPSILFFCFFFASSSLLFFNRHYHHTANGYGWTNEQTNGR
jgi:hypothetical protein